MPSRRGLRRGRDRGRVSISTLAPLAYSLSLSKAKNIESSSDND